MWQVATLLGRQSTDHELYYEVKEFSILTIIYTNVTVDTLTQLTLLTH